MGTMMIKPVLVAVALGLCVSSASAMGPAVPSNTWQRPQIFAEAKIVCESSGYCFRPRGRHPVARWIYGDDAFRGTYTGPGNYGWPGSHTIWWPFGF